MPINMFFVYCNVYFFKAFVLYRVFDIMRIEANNGFVELFVCLGGGVGRGASCLTLFMSM